MFSATQSPISITHSRLSRISVSTAQQTAEHQLSSDFGTCPSITITEFPSHKNEVSKIHKGSCCQQQGFPAEQSQTSSCSNKHSPALYRASQSHSTAWSCHRVRLLSCAGAVTNALCGEGFRAHPCAASIAHIKALTPVCIPFPAVVSSPDVPLSRPVTGPEGIAWS